MIVYLNIVNKRWILECLEPMMKWFLLKNCILKKQTLLFFYVEIAFEFFDNSYQFILSTLFSYIDIAFGFADNCSQSIISIFVSNKDIIDLLIKCMNYIQENTQDGYIKIIIILK